MYLKFHSGNVIQIRVIDIVYIVDDYTVYVIGPKSPQILVAQWH